MHRGLSVERITPDPEAGIEEIDRHLAAYSQSDVVTESGAADAAGRREDLLSNSGLLTAVGSDPAMATLETFDGAEVRRR
jgi:hypothetical protein